MLALMLVGTGIVATLCWIVLRQAQADDRRRKLVRKGRPTDRYNG